MREDVQKTIISKALKENQTPFTLEADNFHWSGQTRVKSKASGRYYEVGIDITISSNKRLRDQIAACLCKPDIRFEDMVIVWMLDPKLNGRISMTGLPKKEPDLDFSKFMKKTSELDVKEKVRS